MTVAGVIFRGALVATFALILLTRCSKKEDTQPEASPVEPVSVFHERAYSFCASGFQDKFLIGYPGEDPLKSDIHFYVVCHKGDTIYHQSWSADAFLGVEGKMITTRDGRLAFLQDRMRAFIDGASSSNMISVYDSLANASAKDHTSSTLSFSYRVGDAPPQVIAWSDEEGKALLVY